MKRIALMLAAAAAVATVAAQESPKGTKQAKNPKLVTSQTAPVGKPRVARAEDVKRTNTLVVPWKMIWHEEFNTKKLNQKNWDTIPRGTADWNRYMSRIDSLYVLEKGKLILVGMPTPVGAADTSKYVTGGLYTRGKFNFKYGKVDICARLESAKGAWPALWMLPDVEGRKWPDQGEIDIMEHLNYDDSIYQTVHSNYTVTHGIKDNPPHSTRAAIDREKYNVYSVEWSPEKIVWLVNDIPTFQYDKLSDQAALDKGQWPFDEAFYLILSQQLGGPGTWVGLIDDDDLPVKMYVDYIRVYQL